VSENLRPTEQVVHVLQKFIGSYAKAAAERYISVSETQSKTGPPELQSSQGTEEAVQAGWSSPVALTPSMHRNDTLQGTVDTMKEFAVEFVRRQLQITPAAEISDDDLLLLWRKLTKGARQGILLAGLSHSDDVDAYAGALLSWYGIGDYDR